MSIRRLGWQTSWPELPRIRLIAWMNCCHGTGRPRRPPWLTRRRDLAPVNKVHHVRTIARVAEMLGENEDWLWDVANEMDQEDGLIWVYGSGDDGVMAFTDFGIETLTGLIEIYKADPDLLKRSSNPK